MTSEPTVGLVLSVAILMGLTSLAMPVARALRLPYTVLIAAVGLCLGLLGILPGWLGLTTGATLSWISDLQLTSDGLLNVFLPPLLFAAGLSIDTRRLSEDLGPVVMLAAVAVLVCTFVSGLMLSVLTGYGLLACLLLGAIVATTDSTAIVAVLRELGAPRRLTVLLEGESLFNDAAAIVLFTALVSLLTAGPDFGWAPVAAKGIYSFLGGAIFGYLAARITGLFIARMRDVVAAEITLTIVLAYLTFLLAEEFLAVSGVIAVVAAAMGFAAHGRTQVSPGAWPNLTGVWRMLEFWATSLVFILAAMSVPMIIGALGPGDLGAIAVLFVATLVSRAGVVFAAFPVLSRLGIAAPVETAHKIVILWGGLRGAVTIALALSINETTALDADVRRFIVVTAIGYVLATLFINATTLRPLLALMGLNRLSAEELDLAARVREIAQEAARQRIAPLAASKFAGENAGERETPARPARPELAGPAFRAALIALASRERQIYFDYFLQGTITREVTDALGAASARMIDGAKTTGLEGYDKALWSAFRPSRWIRTCLWLHRRLGIARPLSRTVALRLEVLLAMDLITRDLEHYVSDNLSRLAGPEIGAGLLDVVRGRAEAVRGAIDSLHIQYTHYLELMRERHLARTMLHVEGREYERQRRLGLITVEVFNELERTRALRLRALDRNPPLDVGERVRRMIALVPLFADLKEDEARAVVRMLKPRLVQPGAVVIEKGMPGASMFFIVSGRLHVELPDQSLPLSRGDYVGEMALIRQQRRSRTVIARGYAYLLELEGRDLRRLMRRMPRLKAAIESKAAERSAAPPAGAPEQEYPETSAA